ncbi:Heme-degrading monooxygenase HmoA [Limimonas halophila]|uniref:Heme-degrading monooxygenase HmoA n=1 Tax=Limimonas halophila TaxID=1082479 RepID=A0A1G7LNW5_9PROT|nr:antibiotic biosynthesis monooxygenase [Limimonas halophila]SDF51081.1 Heme-degrading monooxygenase HmoA [Limimonas halophila]
MTAEPGRHGGSVIVVFEVKMKEGCSQDYFDLAAALKPELEKIDGFISVERFESMVEPGKYVSLSEWRDEAAVLAWREHAEHQMAQRRGIAEIFSDFRIRVAHVARDYTLTDRQHRAAEVVT